MNSRTIRDLLLIASEANRWPRLKHLRDEALRELEAAHLSTVDHIIPVMLVDKFADGKESESSGFVETASASRRTS
jgi:hypothetical protein